MTPALDRTSPRCAVGLSSPTSTTFRVADQRGPPTKFLRRFVWMTMVASTGPGQYQAMSDETCGRCQAPVQPVRWWCSGCWRALCQTCRDSDRSTCGSHTRGVGQLSHQEVVEGLPEL